MKNYVEPFNQLEHEREYILAKVFRNLGMHRELYERWARMNYKPKQIQLKLEL